jgi:RNA-directed DNA polymerase
MKFEKCRLNRLRSKKVLADMLGISLSELRALAKGNNSEYKEFFVRKNGKARLVENPSVNLKRTHHRLKAILSDIPLPNYVYSGRKKVSYRDNAEAHLGNKFICSFDIEKFFPSCSSITIEKFFRQDMRMEPDVARILTRLVSYKGHIPTGSPISQILAYWINYRIFDRIHGIAQARGYTFSLYVDDMTFSSDSEKFKRGFHLLINFLLKDNQLKLKRSKVQYLSKQGPRIVTGCVIDYESQKIKAPNKLKMKVFKEVDSFKGDIAKLSLSRMRSAYGRVNAIRFVEGKVLPNLKTQIEKGLANF